jgi:creatinine amidohydrolase/Fe(II)-dependent formamide hydrolase-like protein/7-cyano-7-deazaguanine synthase in queuosine biosynthesis
VGPVRIEPGRLTVPYQVVRNGKADSIDLIYRYEEDVFLPDDPHAQNLGNMVAAQVALNYGLFCDEIVFRGLFDRADRKFLQEMARNTAREIFVKKFLEPNPFLQGPASKLSAAKRDSYLRATLVFPDDTKEAGPSTVKTPWATDQTRHLILSSGGKDSLLTFGLLREMGRETHPVFVNESGKHWFTALNAYRHFCKHVPNTARVWTNADRVFSWMLRHLPFVRPDFSNVRSDEYPIRLWTVAVFLFGALPIARKRGAGRVLIGDEFDTTERRSHEGITHYNGLYDQSRYFDNALTRYFIRKGWNIHQFSMLRPLSELLIEKTLVDRYPQLFALQVSCHAAHKDGERVRPCGKCEKCRRIVGMLRAIDGDPAVCGFAPDQVEDCLKALARRGVHQESDGAEHLAFLLSQKGLITPASGSPMIARERPQIMKLRFDPERSPVECVPRDLRAGLYNILLEHAQGAVQRNGRVWMDFLPLSDSALAVPYPFKSASERHSPEEDAAGQAPARTREYILGELTWPEAEARFKKVDVALLPVGAIEQHGPHLPLDTDAFDAQYLAEQIAAACSDPKPFILPLVPYGVSYHHDDFSGTISIGNQTLSQLVYEIGMSVARNGIAKLVIINAHGGNSASLHFAAQMINRDARIFTCVDSGETSDTDIDAMVTTPGDVHAGEIETSTSLAIRPQLVQLSQARKYLPRFSSRYLDFSSKYSVDWYARTSRLSRSGVMGDPTKASEEKGRKMWEVMIRNLVELVEHIKGMSLDEIHQRNRY